MDEEEGSSDFGHDFGLVWLCINATKCGTLGTSARTAAAVNSIRSM